MRKNDSEEKEERKEGAVVPLLPLYNVRTVSCSTMVRSTEPNTNARGSKREVVHSTGIVTLRPSGDTRCSAMVSMS